MRLKRWKIYVEKSSNHQRSATEDRIDILCTGKSFHMRYKHILLCYEKHACASICDEPLDMWVYETNGFISIEMLDSIVIIRQSASINETCSHIVVQKNVIFAMRSLSKAISSDWNLQQRNFFHRWKTSQFNSENKCIFSISLFTANKSISDVPKGIILLIWSYHLSGNFSMSWNWTLYCTSTETCLFFFSIHFQCYSLLLRLFLSFKRFSSWAEKNLAKEVEKKW